MQLEDYFNFLAPDDIRLKGIRVGIEKFCLTTSFVPKLQKRLLKTQQFQIQKFKLNQMLNLELLHSVTLTYTQHSYVLYLSNRSIFQLEPALGVL
jgi:hypothetical protein